MSVPGRVLPCTVSCVTNHPADNLVYSSLFPFSFVREVLVFLIRGFGGEVSWDATLAVGATYPEADSKITHQIVDRPAIQNQVLTRTYVQVKSASRSMLGWT